MRYWRAFIMLFLLVPLDVVWADGKIVFFRLQESSMQVFTIDPDGQNLTQVTKYVYGVAYMAPSLSPDGKQLAMEEWMDSGGWGIYLLNLETPSNPTLLAPRGESPQWSPDGQDIAFYGYSKSLIVPTVYTMGADGSNLREVRDSAVFPTWSPDGHRIAYSAVRRGGIGQRDTTDIGVCDVDGTHPTLITNDPFPDGIPDWSPDGKQMLFMSQRGDDTGYQVYVVDIEGGIPERLTDAELVESASWSPTGEQIVYKQRRDLWIMNADGSGKHQLTSNPEGIIDRLPEWWGPGLSTVIQSLSWGQVKTLQW